MPIMTKLIAFKDIKYGFDVNGCLVVLDKTGPVPKEYQPGLCEPPVPVVIASLTMYHQRGPRPNPGSRSSGSLFARSGLPPLEQEPQVPLPQTASAKDLNPVNLDMEIVRHGGETDPDDDDEEVTINLSSFANGF